MAGYTYVDLLLQNIRRDRQHSAQADTPTYATAVDEYGRIVTSGTETARAAADTGAAVRSLFEAADQDLGGPLTCHGPPCEAAHLAELVRVMPLWDLRFYGVGRFRDTKNSEVAEKAVVPEIERDPELYKAGLRGEMGPEIARGLFWLTPAEDLRRVCGVDVRTSPSNDERATRVRNALGLLRLEGENRMVGLLFPPGYFQKNRLAVPNFVDAASHGAFRVWDDQAREYGHAWDLDEQERGPRELVASTRKIDGSREDFEVRYLGRAGSNLPGPDYAKMCGGVA